ncbi:metal-dependent hydrolase family protein [Muriicola jejuensis]|uniref:Amidohydrolase family protein n=1 Tax=Muriicola jejuensis TaxID=504488 RepID=A0A6P0U6J1_9FLAO|nr:amidohydrolase family protein [Muriicola jejuensis]NER08901.1 amidohydrolase family protein [Muriicola jejuensis]
MKKIITTIALMVVLSSLNAQEKPKQITLFTNVQVFDGTSDKLIKADVLVEGNLIKQISKEPLMVAQTDNVSIIDGGGKTLMPGLTDAHTHIMWTDDIENLIYSAPEGWSGTLAAVNAGEMLQRGFTTIRDNGGPAFGLKKAIDEHIIPGPRILPAGAFISQTSGHGDYDQRMFYLSPHFTGQIDKAYIRGWTIVADGVAEVQKASRDVLRSGATHLKVFGSGSITGAHDPIDVTEYTYEELKALADETKKWGTYAAIHAYSDEGIQNAIKAGIKSIEHGLFASEETMEMIKKNDVWFSTQFLAFSLPPEKAGMKGEAVSKYLTAQEGAQKGYERAKKYGVKMTFGTDILGSLELHRMQNLEFTARSKYFTPYEILKQATSQNAELFELSGERHPYKEGKLGVIEEGAYADLLLVNGNPLEDISLLAAPDKNLSLIMKDGVIYKNSL